MKVSLLENPFGWMLLILQVAALISMLVLVAIGAGGGFDEPVRVRHSVIVSGMKNVAYDGHLFIRGSTLVHHPGCPCKASQKLIAPPPEPDTMLQ